MHDDDNHGQSPAAWASVAVMVVAAAVACYAAVFGPTGLLWGGIVVFLAGGVMWYFLERFGLGAARSDGEH